MASSWRGGVLCDLNSASNKVYKSLVWPQPQMKPYKQGTYQVDQVTEVFLYLLWRQAPHQVQGTVQLLITLPRDKQECLSHSADRNTKPPFQRRSDSCSLPRYPESRQACSGPSATAPGGRPAGPSSMAASVSSGGFER